jgi:hypothetical protein
MNATTKKDREQREVLKIYLRALRKDASIFDELARQARASIDYCARKGYSEPKLARKVLDLTSAQLDYIRCREADIRALREGKVEGQANLILPTGDLQIEEPKNGLQIASGLIVDNNVNLHVERDERDNLVGNNNNNNKELDVI